jgi:hypothetical protein
VSNETNMPDLTPLIESTLRGIQVPHGVFCRDPSLLTWVAGLISGVVGQLLCAATHDEPVASLEPFSRLQRAAGDPNGGMIRISFPHLRAMQGSTSPLSKHLGTSGLPTRVRCHHADLGSERPHL